MTFEEAEATLPGVTRKPLDRVAIAPRTRRDRRTRLFWVDDAVREALRNETVAEALARLGDPEVECRSLPEARRHFSEAAGFELTATMVLYAMEKDRITGFRAGEQPYSAIRRWLIIPEPLWDVPTEEGIRAWLKGVKPIKSTYPQ